MHRAIRRANAPAHSPAVQLLAILLLTMAEQDRGHASANTDLVDAEVAWKILLGLASLAKAGSALTSPCALRIHEGQLRVGDGGVLEFDPSCERSWRWAAGCAAPSAELRDMLDLYMPLVVGEACNTLVVAHLGQSLDGRIATTSGSSQFITGEENLVHAHRMRALFDAVLVGAHTASTDNPRLTTRLASGDHATRVLLDPRCSVEASASIFTDDVARTIVICDEKFQPTKSKHTHIGLPTRDGLFDCGDILVALAHEGLTRIFIEGGGVTVSQFLSSGCVHRLQVCVAPMIIGSGRPAFQLPEIDNVGDGLFFDCRHFRSGPDLLFDCQLRAKP